MAEKVKIQMEYPMQCTPKVLFMRLSTPAGLEEWFADKVNLVEPNVFSFGWDGSVQIAKIIATKDLKFVRYKWIDEEDPQAFFEFKISIDELTGDLSLVIVDFVYNDEQSDVIKLWNKQVNELKRVLGSN